MATNFIQKLLQLDPRAKEVDFSENPRWESWQQGTVNERPDRPRGYTVPDCIVKEVE